ncbi:MAG: ATP-dependent sacrificial sulfur transferase LarE [Planctomycetes bacterium]|nr:ATP-dependent sacrificial sulfur transferase LarE [Planctomycetota bacterium]
MESRVVECAERLVAWFAPWPSCAVALSGGVDSAVVASAAHQALGDRAVAFTGESPSLARAELEAAAETARRIGIRHEIIPTHEGARNAYRANAADRCYHCKSELYERIDGELARGVGELAAAVVVNGANLDDLHDYRPGMDAARERDVRSPLAESAMTKEDVRSVARLWGLAVWDKPASPCLASRVAYGEEVTPERLARIERAESLLRELGFIPARVRLHGGEMARIEVEAGQVTRVCQSDIRERVLERLTALGFRFVTVDLGGFRSGSLNALVPLEGPRSDRNTP